ncbi:hypothetical protein N7494_005143, partial [Penicillium frequentans]
NLNLLLALFTSTSVVLGETLQVIDYEGQCFIYSTDNFNCTGVSELFAPRESTFCSSKKLTGDLPTMETEFSAVKVNLCGSYQHIAWVEVYQSGLLYFHNDQGDEASCRIDKSFQKGSSCTVGSSSWTSTSGIGPAPTSSDTTSGPATAAAAESATSTSTTATSSDPPIKAQASTMDC